MRSLDIDQSYLSYELDQAALRNAPRRETWLEWVFKVMARSFGLAFEMPGSGVRSEAVTAVTTGWKEIARQCTYFSINDISSLSTNEVYTVVNHLGIPSGTGSNTPDAFLLRRGQALRGVNQNVWVYLASGDTIRIVWSLTGGISDACDEVRPAEVVPSGVVGTLAPTTTAGGTIMLAADSSRVCIVFENTGSEDVFLNTVGGTPVIDRGIWLPVGRKIVLEGLVAKGGVKGITASGTATVIYETITI
jgi:hypothetical protein